MESKRLCGLDCCAALMAAAAPSMYCCILHVTANEQQSCHARQSDGSHRAHKQCGELCSVAPALLTEVCSVVPVCTLCSSCLAEASCPFPHGVCVCVCPASFATEAHALGRARAVAWPSGSGFCPTPGCACWCCLPPQGLYSRGDFKGVLTSCEVSVCVSRGHCVCACVRVCLERLSVLQQ